MSDIKAKDLFITLIAANIACIGFLLLTAWFAYIENGYWGLTNWAENIFDAWGLFEELQSSEQGVLIGKSSCGWTIQDWSERSILDTYPKTAPLAICLAWIKFKETK